jgi:hypothetical protein
MNLEVVATIPSIENTEYRVIKLPNEYRAPWTHAVNIFDNDESAYVFSGPGKVFKTEGEAVGYAVHCQSKEATA